MKTQLWKKILGGMIALFVGATLPLPAQQRGGGGGFGGFGGGNNNANRSSSSTSSGQYNANGAVGTATITVDPDTRNIVFSTDEQTADQIRQVLKNLDRPKPQVLIKVVFLEVQHNNSSDIGLEGTYTGQNKNFSALTGFVTNFGVLVSSNSSSIVPTGITPVRSSVIANNNFGLAAAGSPNGLYQVLGADFQATLRAIATAGKAELLSRPSILARDGQPATIVVGQSVPLVNGVTYYTSGGSTIPINNVAYTDVGIILKVTPFISPEGYVEMILQPSTTAVNPTQSQTISPGVNAPYLDVRSADTVVVTPDMQTVVIGGLMGADKSSSESKIPFLGDIPWLGNLFKRKTTASIKTELLIFLTPHIIQAPGQLAALTVQEQNHMLTPKSYSEEELNRFLEKVPVKKK